jgi:myo-inositol 2-dehydrogenase/D-chiro-inositol 1-dehydrogenase
MGLSRSIYGVSPTTHFLREFFKPEGEVMKRIKVGIIGLGELGKVHANNLRFKIANADLIAICGIEAERKKLETIQKEWELPYCFFNFEEMLQIPELEAVVIVSSTAAHYEHALAAIKAKKHIFIEKPIGLTIEECTTIEEAANKSVKIFTVGFMRRYDPSYAEAKRMIDSSEIGKPILFRGYSLDPKWVAEYLSKRAAKNGCWFIDMTVHDYDLARWFLDSEAETVYACGGAYVYPIFAETNDVDNGYALMRFKNGSCAFYYSGKTAAHGSHVETEIVGTKGMIRICDEPRRDRIKAYTKDGIVEKCLNLYLERWGEAYYLELQDFINAVYEGRTTGITAHDGTMATTMGIMTQASYVSGELKKF